MSEEFVLKYLSTIDTKKATGIDGISAYVLKLCVPYIVPSLTHILNLSIRYSVFPTRWKLAKVVPIYKSGSSLDVSNYRPISVLPIVSKILEKHVHIAFYDFVERFQLLRVAQTGFRAKHSCETALLKMIDEWLKVIDGGEMIGSILLDLRKAFDLVNHDILLKKLRLYQCSEEVISSYWFQSYLSDRKQCVHLNGTYSNPLPVESGVPQGSIIGPLLFLIYINDFDLCLSYCSADMYADDTTFHVSGKSTEELSVKLSEDLKNIQKWCNDNKMVVNVDKTKSLLICPKQKQRTLSETDTLNAYFDGNRLKETQQEKLLGVRVDSNLTWQDQIDYVCKTVSTRLALLRRIKQFIDIPTRILFLTDIFYPFLTIVTLYGVHVRAVM